MADNANHEENGDNVSKDLEIGCGCGAQVPRSKMEDHATVCSKAVLECLFAEAGCPFKGLKPHLDEHLSQNTGEHLNMLAKKVTSLNGEVQNKNKLLATLRSEVTTLKSTVSNIQYSYTSTAASSAPSQHSRRETPADDPNALTKEERTMRTVHIGNVSGQITQEQLTSFFSLCGPIAQLRLAGDDNNGKSRFAFIEFYTIEGAAAAIGLSGTMLYDRPIKVDYAKAPIAKGAPASPYANMMASAYRYHPYM